MGVLILILLEVGLLVEITSRLPSYFTGLNPYSTGSWVAGADGEKLVKDVFASLNPYSTGSWVAGYKKTNDNPGRTGS